MSENLSSSPALTPDEMEVAAGRSREKLEGLVWQAGSPEELREGIEKAFDYRGDVTVTLADGHSVEGYLFDRRLGADAQSSVIRLIPKTGAEKLSIPYAQITGLAFTGRDTAAGKSWEAWVKKYIEKKAAGETNIEIKPESLDER